MEGTLCTPHMLSTAFLFLWKVGWIHLLLITIFKTKKKLHQNHISPLRIVKYRVLKIVGADKKNREIVPEYGRPPIFGDNFCVPPTKYAFWDLTGFASISEIMVLVQKRRKSADRQKNLTPEYVFTFQTGVSILGEFALVSSENGQRWCARLVLTGGMRER